MFYHWEESFEFNWKICKTRSTITSRVFSSANAILDTGILIVQNVIFPQCHIFLCTISTSVIKMKLSLAEFRFLLTVPAEKLKINKECSHLQQEPRKTKKWWKSLLFDDQLFISHGVCLFTFILYERGFPTKLEEFYLNIAC